LGGNAIMKGMSAKNANKENDNLENNENENFSEKNKNLGEELDKINNLLKDGVLTQEEFEKAKKKILDN
jgi:predicted Zn-dependent peptidase